MNMIYIAISGAMSSRFQCVMHDAHARSQCRIAKPHFRAYFRPLALLPRHDEVAIITPSDAEVGISSPLSIRY